VVYDNLTGIVFAFVYSIKLSSHYSSRLFVSAYCSLKTFETFSEMTYYTVC